VGDLKVNPYGSSSSTFATDDVADALATSSPTDSTPDLDDGSQGGQTTVTDFPKTPLSDPMVANAFREETIPSNMLSLNLICQSQ
jgi:hypothetical protein